MSDGGMPAATTVQVYQTSRNSGPGGMPDHLATEPALTIGGAPASGNTTITVDPTMPRQTVVGFGAALTEAAASIVAGLPATQQQQIMNAYWGPGSSGYTLARTHIGSCDFALSEYSYDGSGDPTNSTSPPDPTLANFSINHDKALLLPFIKNVITATGGSLKLLGSPWSPPGWMKSGGVMIGDPTNPGNDGTLLPEYYGAYAEYLSKYIQAYKAEDVTVWAITPQNEAVGVGGSREGMQFTADTMNNFLKNNLGPTFKTDGVDGTLVFGFDHNKDPNNDSSAVISWPTQFFGDTATTQVLAGTAVHWYDSTFQTWTDSLDTIHALNTNKSILFDEGCDDGLGDKGVYGLVGGAKLYSWMSDEFYWIKDEGDWGYFDINPPDPNHAIYEPVYRYARDIIDGLNHWYVGFIDWNSVLNKDGGPGHIVNPVAAPIMVDTTANTVYMSPTYYVIRQVSQFIKPQAQVLTTTLNLAPSVKTTDYDGTPTQDGMALHATAAKNTDNSIAIVVFNETNAAIPYSVVIGSQSITTTIPKQSVQTLVWQ
jgi:glucosylceramidase